MVIREFQENDKEKVEQIFALYWTDPEFLKELSGELGENGRFFVAEENNEIVGIVGFKKLADYLKPFTLTNNPVEFYVIASKYKKQGIGEKLKVRLIEEVQKAGFTEILLFSPNTHNESWPFHDKLGFERVGEVTPPEDEIGQVWRKVF